MMSAKPKEQLYWLAVLRGFTIVLVVMFHTQLVDLSTGENHELCQNLPKIFSPVRMPFFIFSSGGLLYLSRIRKGWETPSLYKDKLQRIGIPFVFFVVFYYLLKVGLSPFVKTPVDMSLHYLLECFYVFPGHPSAHLWFLATLSTLMALYPLFKWLCKHHWAMWGFFVFCIFFQQVDLAEHVTTVFYLGHINEYLVYFFFGILFFRYEAYTFLDGKAKLTASILLYTLSFLILGNTLPTSLLGIVMMVCIGLQTARHAPMLFKSFRDHIFQIYLMSMFFQAFVELILWKKLFYNEHLFLPFYALNIAAGVYLPVLVSKLAKRTHLRLLCLCLGLK